MSRSAQVLISGNSWWLPIPFGGLEETAPGRLLRLFAPRGDSHGVFVALAYRSRAWCSAGSVAVGVGPRSAFGGRGVGAAVAGREASVAVVGVAGGECGGSLRGLVHGSRAGGSVGCGRGAASGVGGAGGRAGFRSVGAPDRFGVDPGREGRDAGAGAPGAAHGVFGGGGERGRVAHGSEFHRAEVLRDRGGLRPGRQHRDRGCVARRLAAELGGGMGRGVRAADAGWHRWCGVAQGRPVVVVLPGVRTDPRRGHRTRGRQRATTRTPSRTARWCRVWISSTWSPAWA
jgi:hypothetical protein